MVMCIVFIWIFTNPIQNNTKLHFNWIDKLGTDWQRQMASRQIVRFWKLQINCKPDTDNAIDH